MYLVGIDMVSPDDTAPIIVVASEFERGKHPRVDSSIVRKLAALSQSVKSTRASPSEDRRARSRPSRAPANVRKAGRGRRVARDGAAEDSATDSGASWSRRAPVTLMGLCNRISAPNFDDVAGKIGRALALAGTDNARDGVNTIMNCLGASDSYVDIYASLLKRVRSIEGVDAAIEAYASEFLASDPFRMRHAPHPSEDYETFCVVVREKRRRANATEAIAALGFGSRVADRALDALAVLTDRETDADKDLAAKFLAIAVRAEPRGPVTTRDLKRIACDADQYAIDARTRFLLEDLTSGKRR